MSTNYKSQCQLLAAAAALSIAIAAPSHAAVKKPAAGAKARASQRTVRGPVKPKQHVTRKAAATRRYGSRHYTRRRVSRYRRRSRYSYRMARLHLEPARVRELQQALIGAKYLQGEPTGEWDSATRDAMLRYQQDNGFSATGLPDAKSLMKLGLGPHPLPPDVATTSSTSAGADPSPKSDSDNIAPSPSPSSTVSAPPKQEK